MLIYFVRHGETLYNKERLFQGANVDSPLTEEGIEVIKKTSEKLKDINFSSVYVSPQVRALNTMKIIINNNKSVVNRSINPTVLDELREIDLGKWDGVKINSKKHEEQYINLREHPERYAPEIFKGENYASIIKRVDKVIEKIKNTSSKDDNILVVGHGTTLTVMINRMLGYKISEMRRNGIMSNASISIIDFDSEKFISKLIKWDNK